MKKLFLFIALAAALLSGCSKEVTIGTLLEEMVDRTQLAQFPSPSYVTKQFSSYDRATVDPNDPSWFANADRTMFIRVEENDGRKEYVMFDAEGPGAIVRFWMTLAGENSGRGTMRIYFDGEATPAIEGAAFDVLSGDKVTTAPLASSSSDSTTYEHRGHNLYFPLTYAKSCKITYQSEHVYEDDFGANGANGRNSEAVYYNINYRTYGKDVRVETYSTAAVEKYKPILDKVQQQLADRDKGLEGVQLSATPLALTLEAGQTYDIDLKGEAAIRHIGMKLNAANLPQALRSTVIGITFDGEQTVWVPAGDFFGTGYQIRYVNTWYTSVTTDGQMDAYWVMPFKKSCKITLSNLGEQTVGIEGTVETADWNWNKRSMHFGSSWHQYSDIYSGRPNADSTRNDPFDMNYVDLTGKGVYVGDAIVLFDTFDTWWGEGDEKIYIDGETFPSHIGTGTEDYYGYAWCQPAKFANSPWIAQPDGAGNFKSGYTVNIRFRALDAIPFEKSLKVDMEMWHWARTVLDYAPITYWYIRPGGSSNWGEATESVKEQVALKRSDIYSPVITVNNLIEGENLVLKSNKGGHWTYASALRRGWGQDQIGLWNDAKPGDKLVLTFENPGLTKVAAVAMFNKAPHYGTFNLTLNGKRVASNVKLTDAKEWVYKLSLGTLTLLPGENTLEVSCVSLPTGRKAASFGLDKITFEPVK